MANPQKENGFTPIANEIMEALIKMVFTRYSERQVLDCIIRKTYGFNKKEDAISLSQLVEATNLSKRTIVYAIQNLEARKMIFIQKKDYNINIYNINKNHEDWVVQGKAVQYEETLKQQREKYVAVGSARETVVVQGKPIGSARKAVLVVQGREKNGRFLAHTKENKIHKDKQKTGKRSGEPKRELSGQEIGEARDARDIIEAFTYINPAMKKKYGDTTQRQACTDLVKEYTFPKVMSVVQNTLPMSNHVPYLPNILTPHQLFQEWKKLENGIIKIKNQEKGRGLA